MPTIAAPLRHFEMIPLTDLKALRARLEPLDLEGKGRESRRKEGKTRPCSAKCGNRPHKTFRPTAERFDWRSGLCGFACSQTSKCGKGVNKGFVISTGKRAAKNEAHGKGTVHRTTINHNHSHTYTHTRTRTHTHTHHRESSRRNMTALISHTSHIFTRKRLSTR